MNKIINLHRYWELALIITALGLLIVWPINGTTGLKNILLLSGTLFAFISLPKAKPGFKAKELYKAASVILFFIWMAFQAFYISPYPDVAQKQFGSVWLGVLLAAFIGIAIGILDHQNSAAGRTILVGLQCFPFLYILNYINISLQLGRFDIPVSNTDLGIYGDKIKIIFFGQIALAASLHSIYQILSTDSERAWKRIVFPTLCAFTSFASFILVGSKSGVLQGFLLFFFVTTVVIRIPHFRYMKSALISLGIVIALGATWQIKNDTGWKNFYQSVRAGADLEKYDNWKRYPEGGYPVIDGKYETQESAYLRTNGIALGVRCLATEPLGHGHLSEPLRYTRNTCLLANQTVIFTTLSAFLDFSLIVGIPGFLILLSMFAVAMARKTGADANAFAPNRIIPLAMLLTWTLSEVTETHYYEASFFLLSLLTFANFQPKQKYGRTVDSRQGIDANIQTK